MLKTSQRAVNHGKINWVLATDKLPGSVCTGSLMSKSHAPKVVNDTRVGQHRKISWSESAFHNVCMHVWNLLMLIWYIFLWKECHYSVNNHSPTLTMSQLAVFAVLFIFLIGCRVNIALLGPGKEGVGSQLLCGCWWAIYRNGMETSMHLYIY